MTPFLLFSSPEWPPFLSFPLIQLSFFYSSKSCTHWPTFFHCGIWIPAKDRGIFHVMTCFYNWLPSDPQFISFLHDPTFIALGVRNALVFTWVVYWMIPYFWKHTFHLIGLYFWLGVGTYLSLQIGSTPPRLWTCYYQQYGFKVDLKLTSQKVSQWTSTSSNVIQNHFC